MISIPITRHQGETYPVELNMSSAGVTLPIDGFSFVLMVNAKQAPSTSDPDLFESAGDIVDGPNGIVHFPITAEAADNLGRYFHKIVMTDAGGKDKTVMFGTYLLLPTNLPGESFEYTPPTSPADGSPAVVDGSVDYFLAGYNFVPFGPGLISSVTYETRDGRRVIRNIADTQNNATIDVFGPIGPAFPRFNFPRGFEFRSTAYIEKAGFHLYMFERVGIGWIRPEINNQDGTVAATWNAGTPSRITHGPLQADAADPDVTGWPNSGWYELGIRIAVDGTIYGLAKPEADPDNWTQLFSTSEGNWQADIFPIHTPRPGFNRPDPVPVDCFADLWKFEWSRYQ